LHSLHEIADVPNVYVDLSGSGVDGGMLEACIAAAGVSRLLWGTDLTMDTGWAKLRYLETVLNKDELALVRWKNAARIFPRGAFPTD
jgi:predicted TIM-barrel fold metal-dependent hydrolase